MGDLTEFCKNCKRNVSAANFASHSAFCERKIKLCEVCDEPVQIIEFKEHEDEYHAMVACEKCDKPMQKWMLPKHEEICSKRLVPCEFCEAEFPFDEYNEHKEFCGSRTEKCIYCRKYIMRKDKDEHYMDHRIKKMKENVKDEVEQNSINEVISKTYLTPEPKQKIQVTEKEGKEIPPAEQAVITKNIGRSYQLEERSSKSKHNDSEAFSKRYGLCKICNKHIPWIDMNIHIPTCASMAGKCSRCGDDVPAEDIKDHILKNCRKLTGVSTADDSGREMIASGRNRLRLDDGDFETPVASGRNRLRLDDGDFETPITSGRNRLRMDDEDFETFSRNYPVPEENQTTKSCPYCEQKCNDERILEHVRNCEKNTYECPLCLKILPEKDKSLHEGFQCEVLLNINDGGVYHSTTKSYAESVKTTKEKISKRNEDRAVYNYEVCPICNNSFPYQRIRTHVQFCQKNMKPCKFCGSFFRYDDEVNHLKNCPAVHDDEWSVVQSVRPKGAMPKYPVKKEPEHEVPCKKCGVCGNYVPVSDIVNHENHHKRKCCHKKGKRCGKCDCDKQKIAENNQGTLKKLWSDFKSSFTGYDSRENRSYLSEENWRTPTEPYESTNKFTPYSPVADQQAFEPMIPCEFCDQSFPMSEIVLHSTGCNPDLVSFTTKDNRTSGDDRNGNKSRSDEQQRSVTTNKVSSVDRSRFFETKQDVPSSECKRFKQPVDSSFSGEFLVHNKNINRKSTSKYESEKPEVDQALKKEYSANIGTNNSNIKALWNFTDTSSDVSDQLHPNEVSYLSNDIEKEHVKESENARPKSFSSDVKDNENTEVDYKVSGISTDNKDDFLAYLNYINIEKMQNLNVEEPKKHKSREDISHVRSKEVPNLYEEEEPKIHKGSEMEPNHLKLPQTYTSKVKQASDESDTDSENLDNKDSETFESKKSEGSIKMQLHIENGRMDIDSTSPEDIKSNKQKCASKTESGMIDIDSTLSQDIESNKLEYASTIEFGMMDVDSTSLEVIKSDKQKCAFKIEPAISSLLLEKKMSKKTWKIKAYENKLTDEDLTETESNKQCFADFKFGANRNVTSNEYKMDYEDSSTKDQNENRQELLFKIDPVEDALEKPISHDKIAANFYNNIQENHCAFVENARRKINSDHERSSAADNERLNENDWIKQRSRKSSDSE